jgi:hypothetical protein
MDLGGIALLTPCKLDSHAHDPDVLISSTAVSKKYEARLPKLPSVYSYIDITRPNEVPDEQEAPDAPGQLPTDEEPPPIEKPPVIVEPFHSSRRSRTDVHELRSEIRVVDISPASSEYDDIVCTLRHVFLDPLQPVPDYEALSYTWGESSRHWHIWLNKQRFAVGRNLHDALKGLRLKDALRTVWVDALCIDQTHRSEREFMVSRMHLIYRMARRAIAWIGESTPKSEKAVAFLGEQLSEAPLLCDMLDPDAIRDRLKSGSPIPNAHLEIWDALVDFFGRSWYNRAWVIQEVAWSREWVLACGGSDFHGPSLLGPGSLAQRICDAAKRTIDLSADISAVLQNVGGPSWSRRPTDDDLGSVLCINRHRLAKENKDKVYAFTSMLSSKVRELYPRYQEPTVETYYRAALYIISTNKDLKLLAECEMGDSELYDALTGVDGIVRVFLLGLPCWAPNWANERLTNGLWGGYSAPSPLPFAAAGSMQGSAQFYGPSKALSHGMLTVAGAAVDYVARCGRAFYGSAVDISSFLEDILDILQDRTFLGLPDDDGVSAILRTVTLDRNAKGDKTFRDSSPSELLESLKRAMAGRKFFITNSGYIGLGPVWMTEDDVVALVPGCHVPIILREGVFGICQACMPCLNGQRWKCEKESCMRRTWVTFPQYDLVGEACESSSSQSDEDLLTGTRCPRHNERGTRGNDERRTLLI